MRCRICGADEVQSLGEVEYYAGYDCPIFHCCCCCCRFTDHDASIYDWLHSRPGSLYGLYRDLGGGTQRLFAEGDLAGLKLELSKARKYRFIIDGIEQLPNTSRLLEIGCARGFLTSFFILAGYDVTGIDVSPEAVTGARVAFGDYFWLADSPSIQDQAPYDAIYHAGTIGCVGDPKGLTSDLLKMLKPGGRLFFNAPNADSCWQKGQLWIDAAPPPDVVTLFRPGFWTKQFSDVADVVEQVETCPQEQALGIGLMKLLRRSWRKPTPLRLEASVNHYYHGRPGQNGKNGGTWHLVARTGERLGRLPGLSRIIPSQPSEFGLLVTLTKK